MSVITSFLVEQTLLGVKTETTYGTIATLGAGDFLYCENLDLKFDHKQIERGFKYNALEALADASGSTLVNISFETEYQTSGSAGAVVAPYGALENACGLSQSIAAPTVTYSCPPTGTTNFPSVGLSATLCAYYRTKLFTIRGVYGNIEETHASDGLVRVKFTGQGLYVTESAPAAMPTTAIGNQYVKVASASLSTHGYDPEWSEFVVSYGNEIVASPYAGDLYGFGKVMIVRRRPTVKMKVLMDTKAGHDFIGRRINKTNGAITYTCGTGVGNRITYSFPITQYREVDIADENGYYILNVTANVVGTYTKTLT